MPYLAGAAILVAAQSWAFFVVLGEDGASKLARLAVEADLRGENSTPHWRRALAEAPRSALAGVNLALALERAGEIAAAERQLLSTERMNRLWLPRWTLASFYLRHNRRREAAQWGRLALDRSNADGRPALFDLLEQAGVEARQWLSWCRQDPELMGSALQYLAAPGRAADLATATEFMAALDPGRAPGFWKDSLYAACDRLLESGEGTAAVLSWNAVSARRMLPVEQISPRNLIGNPAFKTPLDGQGFNWRFSNTPGVSRLFDSEAGAVRIAFDGGQPEDVELLAAWVWLDSGRSYRFSCLYRVLELAPADAGPVWRIGASASAALGSPQGEPASKWSEAAVVIPALGESAREKLALTLTRRRGSVRATGTVELRSLRFHVME